MRTMTTLRFISLFTILAGSLLGASACGTKVVNGIGTGGGTGTTGTTTGGSCGECASNADCAGKGDQFICNKKTCACVSLSSDLCTTVYTTALSGPIPDDAFILGSILPTVGPDSVYGVPQENAIKLAIDDFSKLAGLPSLGNEAHRPIVLVGCNDGPNEDQGLAAAKHLVDDIGVPAIIGHSFSGSTIELATDVTIPAGVLLISPSATNPAIANLDDNGLVWQIAPPDPLQATAMAKHYPMVESSVRARYNLAPSDPIKVAIVHHNEPYGLSLVDALEQQLVFNGESAVSQLGGNYQRIDYGPADSPDLSAVAKATAFAPHVIFLSGFTESVHPILDGIEQQWSDATHRPFFVLSDAGEVPELWMQAITTEDLRTRVLGTVPGVYPNANLLYATFRNSWQSSPYDPSGSADLFGVAGAYDALYLLAYSAVSVGDKPLTGHDLVELGISTMLPHPGVPPLPKVRVGRLDINFAFSKIEAKVPFDLDGVSGPLDFDLKTGTAPSDIQIWCVPKGEGGAVAGQALLSGVFYSAASGDVQGAYDAACALP